MDASGHDGRSVPQATAIGAGTEACTLGSGEQRDRGEHRDDEADDVELHDIAAAREVRDDAAEDPYPAA